MINDIFFLFKRISQFLDAEDDETMARCLYLFKLLILINYFYIYILLLSVHVKIIFFIFLFSPQVLPSSEATSTATMDLETAIEDAKRATYFFFNNDFTSAKKILEPWAHTSMYHSLGNSVFACLEAFLTFEQVLLLIPLENFFFIHLLL